MADATQWSGKPKQLKTNKVSQRAGTPGQGLAKGVSTRKGSAPRQEPGLNRSDNDGYPHRT